MPTNSSKSYTITFGGWYQRTTIHLSEIYDLLALGNSHLSALSKEKLGQLHQSLDLQQVTREPGELEYVSATTRSGIALRYYEDGLYVLQITSSNVASAQEQLTHYFHTCLHPAISYIFSLGAPTPKVLADISTSHPTVINFSTPQPDKFIPSPDQFGQVYSQISSQDMVVYKTPKYIFVVSSPLNKSSVRELIEIQIFFREFKDQLEKYLNIHRSIWEQISQIKERRSLKGREIKAIRSQLDSYQKTIGLINSRINQMGTYIHTRSSLAKNLQLEHHLVTLFQYKFEALSNTLSYIKEIWSMTRDYLSSAIQIIIEAENQSTNNGIRSLQIITSVGVISGVLGYLTRDQFPHPTPQGLVFFVVLLVVTALINYLLSRFYANQTYQLKFTHLSRPQV